MNWYKKAKIGDEFHIEEAHKTLPEANGIEAIKLKDGRIFYNENLNHEGLINRLKCQYIAIPDFESLGFINKDGTYKPFIRGEEDVRKFFQHKLV